MSDQSSKFIKDFVKENTEQFTKYKKYISNNDWSKVKIDDDEGNTDLKYKTNEFALQNDLIINVVDQLKFFVEKETDHLKPQFKTFVKFSLDLIDIHRQRVNKYVKSIDISNIESQDIRSGEVKFLKECFEKINKVNNTVSLLNIKDESNKGDGIQFYKNQKATIPMIKTLALYNSTIRDIVKGMELPTEITDLTFYIHRNIEDVPVWIDTKNFWEQDRDTFLFWYNEWLKINIGFTIDGYFFHPWLYYHLNFYKTPIPINGLEDIMNPSFRDNEYYIAEILKEAEAKKNVGILLYGSRRIGKSVGMSSICEWKALIKDNASTAITSGSAGDLAELTHKINTSMKFKVPAFQLLIQKQEWDGGTVELGLKWDASTLIEHSRHTIKNLSGGAKTSTQKGAGGAPSVYLVEEIGKFSWEKSYLAAQPSFETPDGYKTTVILVGTSGEASLSGDAMRAVSNPHSFKLLEMNWDLLESKMPASAITWKRRTFANFVPAQMAYKSGFKRIQVPFGKFLGIESERLNKIIINQTDWENNTRVLLEDRERVKLDALKYQQECVQYPIDPTDCFLSANKNPFPYKEAQLRKQYLLESGEWDRRRTIYKTAEGKIGTEHSSLPMAEYPHKGGTLDAPIMIYEDIPTEKPVDNLYVASFDDVKQDDSDTDSLICFQIWKMPTFADEWGGRLVVSWTCRPDDRKPMYEKWLLLQQAYNAMAFPENEDMGYKTFLEAKHLEDKWLIPAIDFTSNMGINSNNKRKFGWMPRQSKKVLLGLLKEKLHNPYVIGEDEDGELITIKEVSLINDITYLDEIINYNEEANVDRISASLGAIGWMHYLESNWILPVSMRKVDPTVQKKPHVKRIFGGSRGRGILG